MAAVSVGGLVATAAFSHAMHKEDEIEELPLSDQAPGSINSAQAT